MADTPMPPWTEEDVDRALGNLGLELLPWQRDYLLAVVNSDGPITYTPRRNS